MIQKIIYVNNYYSWKLFESELFAVTLALGIAPINFKWESKYGSLESLDSQVSIKYLFYIKTGFFWGHVEKKILFVLQLTLFLEMNIQNIK